MKTYGIRIIDNMANTYGHQEMVVSSYESLATLEICDSNDCYELTRENAEKLLAEYERQIKEEGIEWASVSIDEIEINEDELTISEKEVYLRDNGYEIEQAISGYYYCTKDNRAVWMDSACEDAYDRESVIYIVFNMITE